MVDSDGRQLGVMPTPQAITLARSQGVDLVEVAANATPPVCRIVDFGKFCYEQAKKGKENRKRQHSNEVKEVQLSARIDQHDMATKVSRAVDFLSQDMKVKVSLRFRGREMAHKEIGFEVIEKFVELISAYGHPDFEPKLNGRHINLMISPLAKSKRAAHPRQSGQQEPASAEGEPAAKPKSGEVGEEAQQRSESSPGFTNNPFSNLEVKGG